MAAEELAQAGRRVVVAEAKPSPARKFLMAGKSGLNITKDEAPAAFLAAYDSDWLAPMLAGLRPGRGGRTGAGGWGKRCLPAPPAGCFRWR